MGAMRTTTEDIRAAGFDSYVTLLCSLRPETLPELRRVTSEGVRFKDPFHDVTGRGAMLSILERTFHDINDLEFVARHQCMVPQGDIGFLSWRMSGRLRALFNKEWAVEGMSEVHLDTQGIVTMHIDYWDASSGLYEYIPGLGILLRAVRRQVATF